MTAVTRSRPAPDPALDPAASALEPLVGALLRRATHEAAELVWTAEHEGTTSVAEVRRRIDATVLAAAEQGRAEGADLVAADLAAARRRGRTTLLQAQAALHAQVREAAGQAVRDLLDRPGNRDRLEAVLRDALGGPAQVRATADGGLQAVTADGRVLDASVDALAHQAVDGLDLEALWTTS